MSAATGIEWTDATWNPIVGCSIVSPGCTNCYAMRIAARLEKMLPHVHVGGGDVLIPSHYSALTQPGRKGSVWTGRVSLAPDHILTRPLHWRTPRRIFVDSMGDVFHELVPDAWIDRVFAVMALAPQHTFQVLTKRSARMLTYLEALSANAARDAANDLPARWQTRLSEANPPGSLAISKADVQRALGLSAKMSIDPPTPSWPLPNVWLGVSAEDQRRADERREDMAALSAMGWRTVVSYEPALGPVDWTGWEFLSWMISGGESGPRARPSHPDWHRAARDFCSAAGVPYFFKQWGSWKPLDQFVRRDQRLGGKHAVVHRDGRFIVDTDVANPPEAIFTFSVRAHAAGRLLDGVEHNAFPGPPEAKS